jgi:hypothetical protein
MKMLKPTCLSFRRCRCGIEYRITNRADGKAQSIQCQCRLELKIFGTILDAYFAIRGSFYRDWVEVAWGPVRCAEDALVMAAS